MELTLGPILFEWKREEVLKFYGEAADMDVDRVYVGEVVCSKKLGLRHDDIGSIIKRLLDAGKKVTLSSHAVVSNEDELELTRALVSLHDSIEANDMSVFNITDASRKELFAGPHITTYNAPSIEFLKSVGVRRVTFPVELSKESISYNIAQTGVFGEVFAHGKLPLAFSWRCYTSRAHGLTKTDCRHDCSRYPDGMELKSVDGRSLFTVNGTSLLSADTYTLVEFVEELKDIGAGALRISPQHKDTKKIAGVFRKRIEGAIGPGEGLALIKELGGRYCNGWYRGSAGKDYISIVEANI